MPGRAFPHLPESVPEAAFGGEIGRGVEFAGAEAQQHVDAVMRQATESQTLDAHNKMQALSLQLTHDPNTGAFTRRGQDAFNIEQQYVPQFDEQAQQILESVKDPRARLSATLSMGQIRNHLVEQLQTHELQQHQEFAANTSRATVSLAQQTAAANYNHPDIIASNLDHVDAALEMRAHQEGWGPEELTEAKHAEHVKFHQGVLTGMLADNKPQMAHVYLDHYKGELSPQELHTFTRSIEEGESKAAADGIMAAYKEDTSLGAQRLTDLSKSGLTQEQQFQVIGEVERQRNLLAVQRRQDPAIMRQITALEDSIAGGTITPGALGTVESLWRRGAITDDQRLSQRAQIERLTRKSEADTDTLGRYRDAYLNREPLDPASGDDRKGIDQFFQQITAPAPAGSAEWRNRALDIVQHTGIVPKSAAQWAEANLVSGQPKDAAAAAQLLANIHDANPRSYQYVDERTRAMAGVISDAVRAGTDPQVAVDMARQSNDPAVTKLMDDRWKVQAENRLQMFTNKQEVALKRRLSSDDFKDVSDDHSIRDAAIGYTTAAMMRREPYLGAALGYWAGRGGGSMPSIPTAMQADFNVLTKDYFRYTGGNMEQARDAAARDLKNVWGVSEVNGQREFMKFAPERMFPGLTSADIRHDMTLAGYGAAHLVESPETGTSGGKRWSLTEKDDFGFWRPVTDSNGMPVRYELPKPKQPDALDTFKQELQEDEDRRKLNAIRDRENRIAAQGGDIAGTRMPHF